MPVEEFQADAERDLPPLVAARAMLEPDGRWEEFQVKLRELNRASNTAEDGSYRAPGEYLLIKGTKAG